ncbi:cation-translocating P-type ATPase [Euryarchaeota archaeon]|nr:cation-translocating P-type ATPase [Candidatus Thalassarchaeum sp.]MDC3247058.1 cation-translocating P-type ATPase [Euryarchaeota archaeon]MDC3299769.1 cation-translocating P-type ATPase [Euryarchaeota archaeon]
MDEEEFLLLDDEEEVNTPSKEKFKMIKNGDSSWQKVGNAISNIPFNIKESSDMKESIRNNIDNLIPFAKSADLVLDADLAVDGTYDIEWNINGMDCTDCAMKAKRAVNRLPGVNSVNMSVTEGTVTLNLDLARGNVSRANLVLQNLGHNPIIPWQSVSGITPNRAASNLGIERKVLRNTLLEVPGIINVRFEEGKIEFQRINFSSLKMKEISDERLQQLLGNNLKFQTSTTSKLRTDQVQLLSAVFTIPLLMGVIAINQLDYVPNVFALLLSLIGIAFAGFPMFKAAVASIQNKFLGFQVLTSLAVIGAMLMQHYTEALVVTGLVAFASHLEESALVRARNAMQGGLDRLPRLARLSSSADASCCDDDSCDSEVEENDSEEEWIPIEALNLGDIVEIRSGEIIPVDGIIMEGSGAIDRAPLTGEPIPISITKGDFVEAGLVLVRGPIIVSCKASGDQTRLASLIDLVRRYREKPTKTQTTIERFTSIWVPFVLVFSLLYGILTKDFNLTLVLWVVSCPCSLLLAAPVPHATALSSASASGLVARGGDVLESAASIELALLDKTGTLTTGHPKIGEFICTDKHKEADILGIVSALEQRSNHPYAKAIISLAAESDIKPKKVTGINDGDAGVSGKLSGKEIIFGRADWLISQGIEITEDIQKVLDSSRKKGHGVSVLSLSGKSVAAFSFIHDDARSGAKEMIQALQEQGIIVEILSGDEQSSVESFATQIGIDPSICRGNVDPEGKAQWVEERSKARSTLMAGDGFNDAGALAAANIGVAVGSGDQVNLEAADVLIPGDDPRAIVRLLELARRTKMIVNINIAISVIVTLLLVLATITGGNSSIAIGIAIHEASVFLIIINGMFVTDNNTRRITVLFDLMKGLADDLKEAFVVLFRGNNTTA